MFGDNLKTLRLAANETQEALADHLGVNKSLIAQIERGSKPLPSALALSIAKHYAVPVSELIK